MTTTPTTCSYCGITFTEAVVPNRGSECLDAWACVSRKRAQEEAEKQRKEKGHEDLALS